MARTQVTLDKIICDVRYVLNQYSPLKKSLKIPKGVLMGNDYCLIIILIKLTFIMHFVCVLFQLIIVSTILIISLSNGVQFTLYLYVAWITCVV